MNTSTGDVACRRTKSLMPTQKSSVQIKKSKKEIAPLKKSAGSHSGLREESTTSPKRTKLKTKRTITTNISIQNDGRNQKEMLMPPKKHLYTILPIELVYDKESTTNIYQTMVKQKLKPYMVDPELERNDVYTIMPVSVYYENAKHTLYPYLKDPDVHYDQKIEALPVMVQKNKNNNQGSFYNEKIQCNTVSLF